MAEIIASSELVAYCGLYCGACKSYLAGKCPGCQKNAKASWCSIRTCCRNQGISSCAGCVGIPDPRDCGKFNNLIAKFFSLVFRSDRAACVAQIRRLGIEGHAKAMAAAGLHTIKR